MTPIPGPSDAYFLTGKAVPTYVQRTGRNCVSSRRGGTNLYPLHSVGQLKIEFDAKISGGFDAKMGRFIAYKVLTLKLKQKVLLSYQSKPKIDEKRFVKF